MTIGEYISHLGAQQILNPLQLIKIFESMDNLNEKLIKQNVDKLQLIIDKNR